MVLSFKKYDTMYDIIARILTTPNGIVWIGKVLKTRKISYTEAVKIFAYMEERGFIKAVEKKQLPQGFGTSAGKYYIIKGLGYEYLERYKKLKILVDSNRSNT